MENQQEIANNPLPSGDFQQIPENMKSSAYEMLHSADFEEEKQVELDSDSSNADSGRKKYQKMALQASLGNLSGKNRLIDRFSLFLRTKSRQIIEQVLFQSRFIGMKVE